MTGLLLITLFAWADRYCGGGLGWRASFPGRPIYWCAHWILLAGLLLGCLIPAAVWLLWRWPSWKPGKMDPRTPEDLVLTFARHAVVWLAAPWAWWLLLFPAAATALGYWMAVERGKGRDRTAVVEIARGAAFGLLVSL